MFTIEYRNPFGVVQIHRYSSDVSDFTVLPGFRFQKTNTPVLSKTHALDLLAAHGTVGVDGNRTISFYRGFDWSDSIVKYHCLVSTLLIACIFYDGISSTRPQFSTYEMLLMWIWVFAFCLHELREWGNAFVTASTQNQIREDIAKVTGIQDNDCIVKICERHDYNKTAVLRELLKNE